MAWVWTPLAALGLVVMAATLPLAGLVLASGPRRRQNRLLALLLVLEGVGDGVATGVLLLTDDAAVALRIATWTWFVAFVSFPFVYLLLVGTLETRLVAWLRARAPRG